MKRILLILALVFVPSQALSTELQIFDYPWTLRAGLHDDSIYDGSSHDLFRVPGSVSAADTSINSHGTIVGKHGKGSLDHGSILSSRSPALGPEPATMLLLGTGLVALAVLSRKLKK